MTEDTIDKAPRAEPIPGGHLINAYSFIPFVGLPFGQLLK